MALTRLKNVFTSKTGRCIYVNPDDFDASDSFDNRGNSPNRPFKSIQRALVESARFSYRTGQFNDAFESFTIVLYPSEYVLDNRPGTNTTGQAFIDDDIPILNTSSDLDLQNTDGTPNPNNLLYKFNSVEGGIIIPRGTSLVGMDLRKTKLKPLYVPDPASGSIERSAIFRVTGGCYFWQFSFFDGPKTGVYTDPAQPTASTPPTYSHHKLCCFEYADGKNILSSVNDTAGNALTITDLDLYYQKVAKAFDDIPDTTGVVSADEFQKRVEENRIVGPNTSGPITISSIVTDYINSGVYTTTAEVTTTTPHGFSNGTPVQIEGVSGAVAGRFNGSYFITEVPTTTTFRYIIKDPNQAAPANNPTATGSTVRVEIDNVDSASPYIFNISLRSTWGTCGMHADGAKATGFKSMVVAQFTGVSLQKDDNAFIKWDGSTYIAGNHTDGDSIYRPTYRNFHVKCSNDAVIQAVSVFAVGFADHFVALSGGDQSITNSNSNFGSTALRAKGFKNLPFTQDKAGKVTHIIPPKKLTRTYAVVNGYTFTTQLNNRTVTPSPLNATHGLAANQFIRVGAEDAVESYMIESVATNGTLTLNRGYRGSAGTYSVYAGTIDEIPVGYIALDVQKIKYNSSRTVGTGKPTWSSSTTVPANTSVVYGGKAYYTASGGTTGSTAPTWSTAPLARSDGGVTWSYIGDVDTRLYLYGYNSEATKPPYKLQGYNLGARINDVLYVSLIDGSTPKTYYANVTPTGSQTVADVHFTNITTQQFVPGDPNHPLQFDDELNCWYVRITSATSSNTSYGIHYHLGNEAFYDTSLFTGASYMMRIPDNRSSRDRTYRMRYVVDSSVLSRDPINGYIIQPRNVATGQSYEKVYYIYDIEKVQTLQSGAQNGIYYLTLLNGKISPSNGNLSNFAFSQNINNLYPQLDKDNPTEDPLKATSIASNTIVGLVTTSDGTGAEDLSRSITREVISDYIVEQKNNYTNYASADPSSANFITLEARDGDAEELDLALRMIPLNATGGTDLEVRRPSILRSGNHTFEYVGFGPGNYSTGLPSVQNRVLTEDEILLAQSQKEEGGIAFYSGLNSNGDLFIGNTRISSVTGEEESLDTPVLSVVGETANLRPTFDEIIVRDKITIESNTLTTEFKGKFLVQGETTINDRVTCADITVGKTGESSKNIDVVGSSPGTGSANDGDWKLLELPTRGQYTGWYWDGNYWVKQGLTDTGNISITGGSGNSDATGNMVFSNGLGLNIGSTGQLTVGTGATTLGGTLAVTNQATFSNDVAVYGGDITTNQSTFNLINTTATTLRIGGAATTVSIGASSGTTTINNNFSLSGDLTIGGGDLTVGNTNVISDSGGNCSLKGIDSIDATTEATIESAIDTLGNLTSASSLSTIGTISSGTWQGSIINRAYGGTGLNTSTISNGQLLIGSSSGFALANISAGNGISVTNGSNSIQIANTGVRSLAVSGGSSISLNASTGALTLTIGSGSNAYGARTISTNNPSGGSNGDIWYRY